MNNDFRAWAGCYTVKSPVGSQGYPYVVHWVLSAFELDWFAQRSKTLVTGEMLRQLEAMVRDLDMIVYKLELPVVEGLEQLLKERTTTRKELERIRDRLEEIAMGV